MRKVGLYVYVAEATPENSIVKAPGWHVIGDKLDIDWIAPEVIPLEPEHENQLCCLRSEKDKILFMGTPFSSFIMLHTGGVWKRHPQTKIMRGEFVQSKSALMRWIVKIWQNFPPTPPPNVSPIYFSD